MRKKIANWIFELLMDSDYIEEFLFGDTTIGFEVLRGYDLTGGKLMVVVPDTLDEKAIDALKEFLARKVGADNFVIIQTDPKPPITVMRLS